MKLSNFLFVFLLFISTYAVAAKKADFIWAINEGLTHQITVAKEFVKEMKKENINVRIKIFPEREQEKYDDSLQNQDFHITQNSAYKFYYRQNMLKVWEVPFLFRTSSQIEKYIESKNAERVLSKLDTDYEKALTFTFAGGFLYLVTPKKIKSLLDLKGMSCRFDDLNVFFNNFMGPIGVRQQFEEKDASDELCVEELGADFKFHNVRHNNFFNLTGHRVIARVLRVSKKALSKLSSDKREIFLSALKRVTKKERQMVYDETDLILQVLKSRGLSVTKWTDVQKDRDLNSFKKYMKPVMREIGSEVEFIRSLNKDSSRLLVKQSH